MFIQRFVIARSSLDAPLWGTIISWGVLNKVFKNQVLQWGDPQSLPDICDDDQMFAVSLVAVEVRVAHFHGEVHKSSVFHLGLPERWEVVRFRPLNDSPVPQTQSRVGETADCKRHLFQISRRNDPNSRALFSQWRAPLLKLIFQSIIFSHSYQFISGMLENQDEKMEGFH